MFASLAVVLGDVLNINCTLEVSHSAVFEYESSLFKVRNSASHMCIVTVPVSSSTAQSFSTWAIFPEDLSTTILRFLLPSVSEPPLLVIFTCWLGCKFFTSDTVF